jgi:zinc transport system substrate-binding protein
MIRTILVTLFFLTSLFATPHVCVSIPPQAYFVDKIAGDHATVTVLIPPGSSPATYTPKPSQIKAIKDAQIYFTIGVPFEKNWLERFKSINPDLKIIDMTKGIKKEPLHNPLVHHDNTHEDKHHHGTLDPHVWLSPKLALILAKNVADTLSKEDSAHQKTYEENYKAFAKSLKRLEAKISKILKGVKQKTFIVFHPSFGYFAKAFGLQQVAIEKEGKEPSLRYIKRVIDFAKKNHIKTIFVEPQFSQKSARYIAKQIGGKVIPIDPLAYDWDKNLLEIAQSFEKAD